MTHRLDARPALKGLRFVELVDSSSSSSSSSFSLSLPLSLSPSLRVCVCVCYTLYIQRTATIPSTVEKIEGERELRIYTEHTRTHRDRHTRTYTHTHTVVWVAYSAME